MKEESGLIFNIQRCSLDDGPGVRTVLFLKGCPLRCPWCHNPESQNMKPEIMSSIEKCVRCGACMSTCSLSAIEYGNVNRACCIACGACAKVCGRGALELAGKYYTAQEAVDEALRDLQFFGATGGGVTLSGGEPLAQPAFARAVLRLLKEARVDSCVETCGVCADGTLEAMLPYVDHWLFDIKLTDEQTHGKLLGVPFSAVRKSLNVLKYAHARVTLRCPIIPGINDTKEHFSNINSLVREIGAVDVNIMPYHRLGCTKYAQLGRAFPLDAIEPPDVATVKEWERACFT